MVIVDPYPTHAAVMNDRKEGTYLLPASTQFETYGFGHRVEPLDPVARPGRRSGVGVAPRSHHHGEVRAQARLRGRAVQERPGQRDHRRAERRGHHPRDQQGMWTIGYNGQKPRAAEAARRASQDRSTPRSAAEADPPTATSTGCRGPRGAPGHRVHLRQHQGRDGHQEGHPGTPVLYNPSMAWATVASPPGAFRRRTQRREPARRGCPQHELGSQGRLSEFNHKVLKQLGWWDDLTEEEKAAAEGRTGRPTSRAASSGWPSTTGAHPSETPRPAPWSGRSRTRCRSIASRLFSPHRDLVEKYPTYEDRKRFYRLPTRYASYQARRPLEELPAHLLERPVSSSTKAVARSSAPLRGLRSCQQDMFVEINPKDANDRGLKDGQTVVARDPHRGHGDDQGEGDGDAPGRPGSGLDAVPLRRLLPGRGSRGEVSRGDRPVRAR